MKMMTRGITICFLLFIVNFFEAKSQTLKPVKWSFNVEQTGTEATLLLKATIDKTWHLYSQDIPDGGPIPTNFKFTPSDDYELEGKVMEPEAKTFHDSNFEMDLKFFEKEVLFRQKIKLKTTHAFSVKGTLEFMACDDKMCLPPNEIPFSFQIKANGEKGN